MFHPCGLLSRPTTTVAMSAKQCYAPDVTNPLDGKSPDFLFPTAMATLTRTKPVNKIEDDSEHNIELGIPAPFPLRTVKLQQIQAAADETPATTEAICLVEQAVEPKYEGESNVKSNKVRHSHDLDGWNPEFTDLFRKPL